MGLVSTFAENLRTLIHRRGFTRRQFAALLGVDESMVSRWCNEKSEPNFSQMEKMAEVLGCDPVELITPKAAARANHDSERAKFEAIVREKLALEIEGIAHKLRSPKRTPKKQ